MTSAMLHPPRSGQTPGLSVWTRVFVATSLTARTRSWTRADRESGPGRCRLDEPPQVSQLAWLVRPLVGRRRNAPKGAVEQRWPPASGRRTRLVVRSPPVTTCGWVRATSSSIAGGQAVASIGHRTDAVVPARAPRQYGFVEHDLPIESTPAARPPTASLTRRGRRVGRRIDELAHGGGQTGRISVRVRPCRRRSPAANRRRAGPAARAAVGRERRPGPAADRPRRLARRLTMVRRYSSTVRYRKAWWTRPAAELVVPSFCDQLHASQVPAQPARIHGNSSPPRVCRPPGSSVRPLSLVRWVAAAMQTS